MSDNKTKWIWRPGSGAGQFDEQGSAPPIPGHLDDPTRLIRAGGGTVSGHDSDEELTRRAGPSFAEHGGEIEPVVGWIVVVKGAGLGASVAFGSGMSTVGRDAEQRIALPFGDQSMSRSHARMVYDPTSRKFFIVPGEGKNLTRVNGDLLLANRELSGGELIELGGTHVRFVPFCGEHFDWSDVKPPEGEPE